MWPLSGRAQQGERMRRIGVLLPASTDDARFQTFLGAFLQELQSLGWSIGRNVRIDTRWATANTAAIHKHAAELVALTPDVILAQGSASVGPLLQATRTVPIVFPVVVDPVGSGFVESLARPGGNATGFMAFEYSMGGKWLELLKQIAGCNAGGGFSGYEHSLRVRPVRCHPGHGAGAQGRGDPSQHARRRRDRTRSCGLCTRAGWRPDRDGEWKGVQL